MIDAKFKIEPLDEIDFSRRSTDLIRGVLPKSGIAIISGAPGSGKSFVALDAALHVAAGREWAGQRVE